MLNEGARIRANYIHTSSTQARLSILKTRAGGWGPITRPSHFTGRGGRTCGSPRRRKKEEVCHSFLQIEKCASPFSLPFAGIRKTSEREKNASVNFVTFPPNVVA
jgi:hypothetical protein